MKLIRPVPFQGTKEEKTSNYNTHNWCSFEDEVVCIACDSKPWHTHAYYPCGAEAPLEEVEAGPAIAFRFVD